MTPVHSPTAAIVLDLPTCSILTRLVLLALVSLPRPWLTYRQAGHARSRRFSADSLQGRPVSLTGDTKLLPLPCFPSALPPQCWTFCAPTAAPPATGLMANRYFYVHLVSVGAGVPQQLQAIQVHPNTSNSDSSPETSHTSTNSSGRLTHDFPENNI